VDDAPIEEIEVVATASDPRDGSVQVTVIAVDDTMPPSADVATAVQRAPGVVVKRLGGLGDWSSVSIRGSTTRQVEVFLDGLPLNPEGGDAVNLSELPLWAFSTVEVYRGAAPMALDTAASGGAVNLVTGQRGGAQGSLSAGSWGTARMHVLGAGAAPVGEVFVSVDGLVTDGGFSYFDDGGTRTDPSDDAVLQRVNNDTEQLSALLRWRVGDERLGLSVFDAWVHRNEGVPGFTFAPLSDVRYAVDRHLPSLTGHGIVGATRIEGRAWGVVRREERLDPLGELGAPASVTTDTGSVGTRAQVDTAPAPWLQVTSVASVRRDLLSGEPVRTVGRLGAEGVVHTDAVAASVALRGLRTGEDAWWLPRTGLRVTRGPWSMKGGIGQSVRVPDLTELFGEAPWWATPSCARSEARAAICRWRSMAHPPASSSQASPPGATTGSCGSATRRDSPALRTWSALGCSVQRPRRASTGAGCSFRAQRPSRAQRTAGTTSPIGATSCRGFRGLKGGIARHCAETCGCCLTICR
jgi:hypothetical protein